MTRKRTCTARCWKEIEIETNERLKSDRCQSCGICIGLALIESWAYQVGKFRICGWCLGNLTKHGHIELDGRQGIRGKGTVCRWLYPDGSVKPMRVICVMYPNPEVLFMPLDTPLPEGVVFDREGD